MSKKMKGVALGSSPYAAYEDAKSRIKHQNLLQDYQELQKETDWTKENLEELKQKKLTLLAEVRFLKRRYNLLMKNSTPKPPLGQRTVQLQKLETQRKTIRKDRNYNRKQSALRIPVPATIDSNQKEMKFNGKKAVLRLPLPGYDLNHQEKIYTAKEVVPRNSSVLDLNENDRIYSGQEAGLRNPVPVFDLNQISREEEEFQVNGEPVRVEEQRKSLIRGGNEEQYVDMKLSACRNISNGSNRAGKRKISWQDQVALRV
ncbi:uncharacterized protein LOC131157355 [Malania oleifera]|uniref:uncharacterized protein LOC131157355 n=1 Tax=Malania oleifera TaxID=397392 RepID=UPI0025AE593E|nr:uncharacterized protein LOC131157355 [Malania oleifera]